METQELRNAGLKVTHPRMSVLKLLEKCADCHLSAAHIYRRLLDHGEDIGLATVYRVLTQSAADGLVLKHKFEDDQTAYALHRCTHHAHMIDVYTGNVLEYTNV